MSIIMSQINSNSTAYSPAGAGSHQRKRQTWGESTGDQYFPHKGPVMRKTSRKIIGRKGDTGANGML